MSSILVQALKEIESEQEKEWDECWRDDVDGLMVVSYGSQWIIANDEMKQR